MKLEGGGEVAQNLTSKKRQASSLSEGVSFFQRGGGGAATQVKSDKPKKTPNDRGEVYFRGAHAPYAPLDPICRGQFSG